MALCDQLEEQQQERERRFPVLSRACHASFAEAPTPANLNRIFDEIATVSSPRPPQNYPDTRRPRQTRPARPQ